MNGRMYPHVCANCKWWVPRYDLLTTFSDDGACHRYPPKHDSFPAMRKAEWCGEFAIMEHPRIRKEVDGE